MGVMRAPVMAVGWIAEEHLLNKNAMVGRAHAGPPLSSFGESALLVRCVLLDAEACCEESCRGPVSIMVLVLPRSEAKRQRLAGVPSSKPRTAVRLRRSVGFSAAVCLTPHSSFLSPPRSHAHLALARNLMNRARVADLGAPEVVVPRDGPRQKRGGVGARFGGGAALMAPTKQVSEQSTVGCLWRCKIAIAIALQTSRRMLGTTPDGVEKTPGHMHVPHRRTGLVLAPPDVDELHLSPRKRCKQAALHPGPDSPPAPARACPLWPPLKLPFLPLRRPHAPNACQRRPTYIAAWGVIVTRPLVTSHTPSHRRRPGP
jgi:hypothetical protein